MTRYILKLLICFLLAFVLAATYIGCQKKTADDDVNQHQTNQAQAYPPGPSKVSILKVVLPGPFAVIVRRDHDNRIIAYVPFDDDGMHQFYYPYPGTPRTGKSFHFDLSESGLETPSRPTPYVDRGFDDFIPTLPDFKPDPKKYYVTIDLPAPDVVSFIPPPEGVLFQPESMPRFGRIPTSHVIEYRVRDASKIVMHSKELGELYPEPCREESRSPEYNVSTERAATVCYMLGVRPSYDVHNDPHSIDMLREHAINFFNDKLLPSMFGPDRVPTNLKLFKVGVDPSPKGRNGGYGNIGSPLTPAVWREPLFSPPHLIEVGIGGTTAECLLSATAISNKLVPDPNPSVEPTHPSGH